MIAKEAERQSSSVQQDAMILLSMSDGETRGSGTGSISRSASLLPAWDSTSASPTDEIESELRRSLFPEMKSEDLKKTIILNAKSLIERDADFSKFAGRILLSYIYEEVLDWDIVTDGIDEASCVSPKGIPGATSSAQSISSESIPRMLDLDLDKLARRHRSHPLISTSTTSAFRRSTTAISSWTRSARQASPQATRNAAAVLDARRHGSLPR